MLADQDAGGRDPTGSGPLTDAELTRLALAAPLMAFPADDAVPLADFLDQDEGLLPAWYMPTPMIRLRPRWQRAVVLLLIGAFVAIEAAGLCSTFGQVVPA